MFEGDNMRLRIDDLVTMQKELDERIFILHNVTRMSTRQERLLALLVELGEMINETKSFKYWSLKPASNKEIILEEYGDGIHFFLSLGIDLNDNDIFKDSTEIKDESLNSLGLILYQKLSNLAFDFNKQRYDEAFALYLQIGEQLGFTPEDIRRYYLMKNEINHQRQDQQY